MKLAAYLRVSTAAQVDGYGLDAQREAIERWAAAQGHQITAWCSDEGVSGSNGIEAREGLPEALRLVKDGDVAGVVAARMDRFARELTIQEAILSKTWGLGGRAFTADQGEILEDDPDDPLRKALRQIVGVIAELDRAMISKRLRDGRRAKAARGGYATGRPGYGWRAENGELVPVTEEQAVIAKMRRLREGRTLREVAAILNGAGLLRPGGGRWHAESVRRVLARS